MKKRLLRMLLALVMVLSLMPAIRLPAAAEEHDHSDWTGINTTDELTTLFTNGGSGYLTTDITISSELTVGGIALGVQTPVSNFVSGEVVNLCLNGHVIKQAGTNQHVFCIPSGATLNLYDCPGVAMHYFSYTVDTKTVNTAYADEVWTYLPNPTQEQMDAARSPLTTLSAPATIPRRTALSSRSPAASSPAASPSKN